MIHDDATRISFGPDHTGAVGKRFETGEYIGETFLLRRILGRGGMSQVFEAEDVRLARRVAIKVVDDVELGGLLVLEARAIASVRHPGVPIVHGLGSHRGWTYLVLERLYGIDLERHLELPDGSGKRLDANEAVPILASIADALAAVHRAGLAHRDLKPANVMLCPEQRVVLVDFGIVVPEVDAEHTERSGTPRYVAPEILSESVVPGHAHLIDTYAFGAVAFEMFAGRPPFCGGSIVEMLQDHVGTPAPDLAEIRPDLPPELSEFIAACLAKDPAHRPADMETIAEDLRALARRSQRRTYAPMRTSELRETYRQPPATEAPLWEVLIVEDDDDIREGLADVLNARGFRAQVAANGREAHDLIARTGHRPSVILLDLMMPVMDGQSFLEHQASNATLDGVPVLLVTAQPPEGALRFPSVRGVVQKPLEIPTLLRHLGDLCFDSLPTLAMEPLAVR